jgi:hypothetical protein
MLNGGREQTTPGPAASPPCGIYAPHGRKVAAGGCCSETSSVSRPNLDDYAAGNYAKAAMDYTGAYEHMFMTADIIAGAILRQKRLEP